VWTCRSPKNGRARIEVGAAAERLRNERRHVIAAAAGTQTAATRSEEGRSHRGIATAYRARVVGRCNMAAGGAYNGRHAALRVRPGGLEEVLADRSPGQRGHDQLGPDRTAGQSKTHAFASEKLASHEVDKLTGAKTRKGYQMAGAAKARRPRREAGQGRQTGQDREAGQGREAAKAAKPAKAATPAKAAKPGKSKQAISKLPPGALAPIEAWALGLALQELDANPKTSAGCHGGSPSPALEAGASKGGQLRIGDRFAQQHSRLIDAAPAVAPTFASTSTARCSSTASRGCASPRACPYAGRSSPPCASPRTRPA